MNLILHDYRRCPFCIRVRIVLYLKNIPYERVCEPLREWTDWMKSLPDPRVPILREVTDNSDEVIHRESNQINLWLDQNFGSIEFTPEVGSTKYLEMQEWWEWCADVFKPTIDLYKYGEDRVFDREKHEVFTDKLSKMIKKLEQRLVGRDNLVGETLTLADIAIIPFVRQIMRTRNGEFDFSLYPHVLAWANQILDTEWFTDIVMAK